MAVDRERLEAAVRNAAGETGSKRLSETPQGTWLGRARIGNLWLCYAGPLAGRQKSGISGNLRRSKPISRERNSWGS